MNEQQRADLTDLIRRVQAGDKVAFDALFHATYPDLRRLARERLGGGEREQLLDTTSLVHESYLRFAAAKQVRFEDRDHFMCYAARVMHSVIVDFVRERRAERRGGDLARITLTTRNLLALDARAADAADEILRVHEALEELRVLDERLVKIVEMRYFGGMTEVEVAAALDVSERTVRRDWEKARLLLAEALA